MPASDHSIYSLSTLLTAAERGGYAVGAFSPRYTAMIRPVLQAGQALASPLIVQISQRELARSQISPGGFAREFFAQVAQQQIAVPVALHLDHTRDFPVIEEAIAAGFTSVMIDASDRPLEENIAITRQVVAYAHRRGASVEAELGRITTTDHMETDDDAELFTDPEEAGVFVAETGVDALAVSVGTAHGVYVVRQPRIDYERLRAIRARTAVHLVLHGGSGVPAAMIERAVSLPGGGVSKVNIATELELAALAALGRDHYLLDAEMSALSPEALLAARQAVGGVVRDKIQNFLHSDGRAAGVSQ